MPNKQQDVAVMLLLAAAMVIWSSSHPLQLDWRALSAQSLAEQLSSVLPCIKGDAHACWADE
jgi:hypothetical protein